MFDQYESAKLTATNLSEIGESGNYEIEMFLEDFPQFFTPEEKKSLLPEKMLLLFLQNANSSILPSRWGDMWRYAAGLHVAHFAAMYLKTYDPGSESAMQVAMGAQQVGVVKSATMGDTSISYDNAAITAGMDKWGAWNATQYGQQLVTMARLVGMGGMYVI